MDSSSVIPDVKSDGCAPVVSACLTYRARLSVRHAVESILLSRPVAGKYWNQKRFRLPLPIEMNSKQVRNDDFGCAWWSIDCWTRMDDETCSRFVTFAARLVCSFSFVCSHRDRYSI